MTCVAITGGSSAVTAPDASPADSLPAEWRERVARVERVSALALIAGFGACGRAGIRLGDGARRERAGIVLGTAFGCLLTNAEFQRRVAKLERAVSGTVKAAEEVGTRLEQLKQAIDQTPGIDRKHKEEVRALIQRHRDITRALSGDSVLRRRNENVPPSVAARCSRARSRSRRSAARTKTTSS